MDMIRARVLGYFVWSVKATDVYVVQLVLNLVRNLWHEDSTTRYRGGDSRSTPGGVDENMPALKGEHIGCVDGNGTRVGGEVDAYILHLQFDISEVRESSAYCSIAT